MNSTSSNKGQVVKVQHSLIDDRLTKLRDKNTDYMSFRQLLDQISMILACELTRELPTVPKEIETPVCKTTGKKLAHNKVILVPILRAGLGMVEGILKVLPEAKIGHIGLARNEETLKPSEYYFKLPQDINESRVILVDPMLATGGSILYAIKKLKSMYKIEKFVIFCLLASPEGIERVHKECPDVDIYCAAIDEKLDENGYIVPGLGDAGDRINGTFEY